MSIFAYCALFCVRKKGACYAGTKSNHTDGQLENGRYSGFGELCVSILAADNCPLEYVLKSGG